MLLSFGRPSMAPQDPQSSENGVITKSVQSFY
jgi:hypothetical protein